jgi:ATP synthase protein I
MKRLSRFWQHLAGEKQSFWIQVLSTLVVGGIVWLVEPRWALSLLAGGILAAVGNLVIVLLMFRTHPAAGIVPVGSILMMAEVARLLIVAAGFALIFHFYPSVFVPALFVAFLIVHLIPVWWVHRSAQPVTTR